MKQKASGGTEGWKKLQTETRANEDRNCQGNILPSGNMALKMKKKLFFCKNEKNNFFVYFLYFLFHFHRIPMTCCQNVLIAAETKFCHENEKPKLFISCRFFLNLSSRCDLIFLSLLIATLQMISLSDGDWKGKKEEEYWPFLIESPMPGENKLTKILSWKSQNRAGIRTLNAATLLLASTPQPSKANSLNILSSSLTKTWFEWL